LGGRFRISPEADDVPTFLAGETDDHKVEELLWGLILIDGEREWREPIEHVIRSPKRSLPLPHPYALLKLAFLPHRLSWPVGAEGVRVKPEPEILGRLRAGDAEGACEIAARRLRASGFVPMPGSTSTRTRLDINASPRINAVRLAATLLLPISETVTLARLALRPPSEEPEEAIV
jgi:CRISPR-associated protein Csx17